MCYNLCACLFRQLDAFRLNHRHAFLKGKQRTLVAVDRNADDQAIHQHAGAAYNINMTQSYRVKGSWV